MIAKLNHLFISLPDPSVETISKLNILFYKFIWQSSTDRIKREVLCQEYCKGGLKMTQLNNYIYGLKISWIRRLINGNTKYKILFETVHTNVKDILSRGEMYIDEIKKNVRINFGVMFWTHGRNLFCILNQLQLQILWVSVYGIIQI